MDASTLSNAQATISPLSEERAAIKIQSVVRGHLARKSYYNHKKSQFADFCKNDVDLLFHSLVSCQDRLQQLWNRQLIDQAAFNAGEEQLTDASLALEYLQRDLRRYELTGGDFSTKLTEFENHCFTKMGIARQRIGDTARTKGFSEIQDVFLYLLGRGWEDCISDAARLFIEDLRLLFTPMNYDLIKTYKNESDFPYFTFPEEILDNPALIDYYSELNFCIEGVGTLRIGGIFKQDHLNIFHIIPTLSDKMEKVITALKEGDTPIDYAMRFLKQYSLRDFLIRTPSQMVADMEDTLRQTRKYRKLSAIKMGAKFGEMFPYQQVQCLRALLLGDETKIAYYLFHQATRKEPEYRRMLRECLHYTLQKKLDLSEKSMKALWNRLRKFEESDISYKDRILLSNMSETVKKRAIAKVKQSEAQGSEGDKAEKWLDGLLRIPFGVYTQEVVNTESEPLQISDFLKEVDKTVSKGVYGYERAKKVLLQWLSQRISNGESKGESIGLFGPPGTGKTTFAKQLAKALGRPFFFIQLGGLQDSVVLKGHSYTYSSAEWGQIAEILMEAGCMDPVIFFDELDKVSGTEKGREIISVLTALTDPAQNSEFSDTFFKGIKFDLSRALFLFSYNDPSYVNGILRDRFIEMEINPLTLQEKLPIARDYLLPDIFQSLGLELGSVKIEDPQVLYIIENYTAEAGARRLKEHLVMIFRELNYRRLQNPDKIDFPVTVDEQMIDEVLNRPKIERKKIHAAPHVGIVNGLYANGSGMGGITPIEVYPTFGKAHLDLLLTGNQGKVMQESMNVARTVAWNLLSGEKQQQIISGAPFGLHIHVPSGATPKDGPSAGGAITTAIYSRLTAQAVRHDVTMTGEIELTGRITAIGGLMAKLQGAKKAGARLVLIPKENVKDLEKIMKKVPDLFDETFAVLPVETIEDILRYALVSS